SWRKAGSRNRESPRDPPIASFFLTVAHTAQFSTDHRATVALPMIWGASMKRLAVATLGVLALGAGSVSAADLPPVYKAPPVVTAPAFSWTGFYVGGNIGYGWGPGPTDITPLPSAALFVNLLPQTLNADPRGVIGGGQFGFNYQAGALVWGLEVDVQAADIK